MCEFCDMHEYDKELAKASGRKRKYYAAMHTRSVVNGREKGRTTHEPVKLNFCPLCGNKLEKAK